MDIFLQLFDTFSVLGSWIIAGIIFIITKIRKHIKQKKAEKISNALDENKETQKKKEEDLKGMAVFLCDKCSKQTEVKNGKHISVNGKEYDVCESCASELSVLTQAVETAAAEYASASEKLREAREALNKKFGG